LKQDGILYAGPGNADFEQVASLKASSTVSPLATFGDFVQVATTVDGQELHGYVWKNILAALPAGLPALASASVPWQPLYLPDCSPGNYTAVTDAVVFSNDSSTYLDNESSAIPLAEPLSIAFGSAAATPGDGAPAIKILGIPEQSTGDWWKGITRLEIGYAKGNYYIGIRDGTKADDVVYRDLPIKADQTIQLAFDQPEGKSFRILDGNGQVVQTVDLTTTPGLNLPDGLFPNGVVYIGTTLPPLTTFTLTGLRIGLPASGKWVQAQNGYYTQPGLAELAVSHHVTIGTEFSVGYTSDPRYCRTMQREFNVAVLSEFSSPAMWLGIGQYDFSAIDQAVDYASRHGWRIRASHLLWGNPDILPDWLKNSHYTREQYIQIMEQYIKDVVGRYRGRVQEWSIANEAISRSFSSGTDFWNDKIGPDYISLAFITARQADPEGLLIFNDYNNQAPQDALKASIINKMYTTVKQLKAEDVPIDVVGMQMHLFMPWLSSSLPPQKADVVATMQKFAALGVRIDVTEMDVDLARQPGSQAEKWAFEAGVYGNIMEACLESGVCNSFATWDISDATSWISCTSKGCLNEKNADPLMFDPAYVPKPAYFAVRDALTNDFSVIPLATPTK
jgi:endo-1,4-beta-xylanase